jgi:hypothetical protein
MVRTSFGLRRVAILFAVAVAGALTVGAQAASAGVIEICKSSANGMSGRTFQYSITGGAAVSVAGGRCSGPIQVAGAQVTVTEAQSTPATDVASTTVRPSIRKLSENLPGRSVTVATGASTASETLVTFTNQPAGGNVGTLKVCKLTQTPAYLGRLFSFSVNGGPVVSAEANDANDLPANWSCRILGTFQVGSTVSVHEAVPAGTEVQFIDTDPPTALVDFNLASGDALVNIGAGTTVVLYDDEPLPPSGTGWLEICKDSAEVVPGVHDPDVVGPFRFTVTDAAGATYGPLTVVVPSPNLGASYCTEPFQVAAGIAEVTELASPGYDLVDAFTVPADRSQGSNLINRTADVEVPASASSTDETQVHFVNQTQRGQLKICKTLGPGSADLVGRQFNFTASFVANDGTHVTVLVGPLTAQATTQCIIAGIFPIGATVDVEESLDHGNGQPGEFIDTTGEGPVTIAAGINTVTITNTARGLLEICKARVVFSGPGTINYEQTPPPPPPQPTFTFRIDGNLVVKVRGGTCSLPLRVSVGRHTVTENAEQDYELDPYAPGNGITVNPPANELSRNLNTRTVTVNVLFGQDTAVTFSNRVKLGQIKICKQIPLTSQDSLGNKGFSFNVSITSPGTPSRADFTVGPVRPGECSFPTVPFPVLGGSGQLVIVNITELGAYPAVNGFVNTSITCVGCRDFIGFPQFGNGDFSLGPGINAVTYVNKATDP